MRIIRVLTSIIGIGIIAAGTCGCSGVQNNSSKLIGMPNPWSECRDSYTCASKIAGFTFPLKNSNYTVRAMKGMIEVTYPLDENRCVTVRKGSEEINNGDNSGDYTKYPQNEIVTLDNGVKINVRKKNDKIYVMYFSAESGYFSARCPQGMTLKEVENIYKVIADVETSNLEINKHYKD